MKWFAAFAFIFGSTMVYAESNKFSVPVNPKWKVECGSCHIAYPPQLLTENIWQRLMGGLDEHFGANAMLDPNDNKEILDFLQRYAGHGGRYSASSLRIVDTPWFTREHQKISNDDWFGPAVKSRSNCTACHVKAEHGDWSESGIKMPGSQPAEQREEPSKRGDYRRDEDREGERDKD